MRRCVIVEAVPIRLTDAYQNKGNAVISFAAVVVIVIGLQMAKDLLVPFLFAVFLALITVRPMLWMQQKRVPAVLAVLLIVSLILAILAVLGTIVGASIAEFTAALPAESPSPAIPPSSAAQRSSSTAVVGFMIRV